MFAQSLKETMNDIELFLGCTGVFVVAALVLVLYIITDDEYYD